MYYLGIDGGGTKTAFIVIDDENRIVYEAKSGPSSLDTVDFSLTKEMFRKEINKIPFEITKCFAGLGGVADKGDQKKISDALQNILPNAKVSSGSDTVNALFASLGGADGIAIIAGTGSAAFGKHKGIDFKAGGYGYTEGDPGSSFDLGINALRYLAKTYDGRKEPTEFSIALAKEINCYNREELVQYFKTIDRTEVAKLAKVVTKNSNDENAKKIITDSVNGILEEIESVYHKLNFVNGCPFSIIGSLGLADTLFKELLLEGVKKINENISFVKPINDAPIGAALKAKSL